MSIFDLIEGNIVQFDSYREGYFYYNIITNVEKEDHYEAEVYQFTIPLADASGATLLAEDKAVFFMRWIRKAYEEGTLVKLSY